MMMMEVVALSTTATATRTSRTLAAEKAAVGNGTGAPDTGRFVPGPEFTQHMIKKAKRLIDQGMFAKIGDGACQVASSDGSSYFVSVDPNNCECASFKIRRICSHLLVVQMISAAGASNSSSGGSDGVGGE